MRGVSYSWQAILVFLAVLIGSTFLLRLAIARVPAFRRMQALNDEADAIKIQRRMVKETVDASNKAGLATNLFFYALVLPWCLDLAPRPWWRYVVEVVAVLMLFDFMYYWTHRLIFHGPWLRKVHALHHQAHTPTNIDGYFVHPLETTIGIVLFLISIPIVALVGGAPLHAVSAAVATLLFTQLNILNHTFVYLPDFPFRAISNVTWIHAAHHVSMNKGNYATLTMLYDRIFGTYEKPVSRPTP
jgi:sterol desaturase/sphingolipid hydroxylase (fatty acid hydroxylase superfamily)